MAKITYIQPDGASQTVDAQPGHGEHLFQPFAQRRGRARVVLIYFDLKKSGRGGP